MSERYFPGQKIRITIDAEVSDHSGDELEYTYPTALGAVEAVAVLDGSPVTVERVAPAEWPPRPGDLWRNRRGVTWFGVATATGVRLVDGRNVSSLPEYALAARGPLTLVHREDEQDGSTR